MEREAEQFKKDMKKISLKDRESSSMKDVVLAYAKNNPPTAPGGKLKFLSPWYYRTSALAVYALLFIFILTSGGVSAAENSVPGDALYGIKIHFNEPVASVLALSDTSKAEVEVDQAEERLIEIEKLSIKGQTDPKVINDLTMKFQDHSNNAHTLIAKAASSGDIESAADASSDLETTMEAHSQILDAVADTNVSTGTKEVLATVQEQVDAQGDKAEMINSSLESTEASSTDTQEVQKSASDDLQDAAEKVNEADKVFAEQQASGNTNPDQQEQLNNAKDLLAQAKQRFNERAFGDASSLSNRAKEEAAEISVVLQVSDDLNIDITDSDTTNTSDASTTDDQ